MEVLLILAVVVGVAVGVGFATWLLTQQDTGAYAWAVDAADTVPELEKQLNRFSEKGLSVHRILSAQPGTEQPSFVIIGRILECRLAGTNLR